jgi:biotin carboxyl carrier protein
MRRYTIEVNGKTYMLDVRDLTSDTFEVLYEDHEFTVQLVDDTDLAEAEITPVMVNALGDQGAPAAPVARAAAPRAAAPRVSAPKAAAAAAPKAAPAGGSGAAALTAPMPGVILSVDVKPGARVKRGDILAKLEAMKMVNPLRAPKDTVIADILVADGQMVAYGDTLMTFGE